MPGNSKARVVLRGQLSNEMYVESDLTDDKRLWLVCGSEAVHIDLWLKQIVYAEDLRVVVRREENAVEVALDVGENNRLWWHGPSAPRLRIEFAGGQALVKARIGRPSASAMQQTEDKFSEFELGVLKP